MNQKIEIIKGDCMEFLKQFEDNAFDLAVVDPPYGLNEAAGKNKSRGLKAKAKDYGNKEWDKEPPPPEYFEELLRVSRFQIIWGANHFIDNLPTNKKNASCWLVWDKNNGNTDQADCEMAWTNFKKAARLFKFTWSGMRQGDMKNKEKRIHPTQKPVRLYDWIFHKFAQRGWNILDTHLGSASSAISAHFSGLDLGFVGIEKDEEHFADANKRFNAATQQTKLNFITNNI